MFRKFSSETLLLWQDIAGALALAVLVVMLLHLPLFA